MRQRRQKRTRRTRKTRRLRGGALPFLKENAIQWPDNNGCLTEFKEVRFQVGDTFDRFGSETGLFVSPTFATADKFAAMLDLPNPEAPNRYSYTQRALPYAGVNNAGFKSNNTRRFLYTSSYKQNLNKSFSNRSALNYHQYRVVKGNTVYGQGCVIAPSFNTDGGGIQVMLNKPIYKLLAEGAIREEPVTNIPGYFPMNESIAPSAQGY